MADQPTVEYNGKTYRVRTGELSLTVIGRFFAFASSADADSEIPFSILVPMIEHCLDPADIDRFWKNNEDNNNAYGEGVQVLLAARMEAAKTEHPTGQPSDSTDGPVDTEPKSEPSYDARVWELAGGQPDKYLMLMQHKERRGLQAVA